MADKKIQELTKETALTDNHLLITQEDSDVAETKKTTLNLLLNWVISNSPVADSTTLGSVKVDNQTIKINDGVISADIIGNWSAGVGYPVGYFVVYNDNLYQCINANSDIEWTESNWSLVGSNTSGIGINNWSANTLYKVRDLVINNTTIYQCNTEHTSGETFDETESANWTVLTGEQGIQGDDGYSPIVSIEQTDTGCIISITDVNGTTTSHLKNGADGASPSASVIQTETGVTITITDNNGTTTANLSNGVNGKNGKSAYQSAVDNGFVGTEEEWLVSLRGADGVTTIQTTKVDKICTFSADGWSDTMPYTQTVNVDDITESLNPRIDLIVSDNVLTGRKEEIAFSYFTRVVTGDGVLTAYCYENKPDVDLNIMIEVI